MNAILYVCLVILVLVVAFPLWAEDVFDAIPKVFISELEFINQPIAEIIIALAQLGEFSLLPSQEVSGQGSYYFRDIGLSEALQQILEENKLFLYQQGSIFIASPIQIIVDGDGRITLKAENAEPRNILQSLSRVSNYPIRFTALPADRTSIHIENRSVEEVVEILMLPYPEYTVQVGEGYINIYDSRRSIFQSRESENQADITVGEEGMSISGKNISATMLLSEIFALTGQELLLFTANEALIQELRLVNMSFEEILELITSVTGLYYREHLGVYAFFQASRSIGEGVIWEFEAEHQSAEFLIEQAPQSNECELRSFPQGGAVYLLGDSDACQLSLETLQFFDKAEDKRTWLFSLNFINSQDLFQLLPSKFAQAIQESQTRRGQFYATMDRGEFVELQEILKVFDRPEKIHLYTLKHITSGDLLEYLPSDFPTWRVQLSKDPSVLYISGDAEIYEQFRRLVEPIDRPEHQIQYQVLIVQYQQSDGVELNSSLKIGQLNAQSRNSVESDLSKVLALNFDIISSFGYGFAAELSLNLSSSKARILADTLLRSESKKPVRFENTSTFRYREESSSNNATNGSKNIGVVRELTTGLLIEIEGSVDASGIINMDISVQLSKQGIDLSTAGSPPPSSKREVQTSIKTRSGEAVRVAGIVLWEDGALNSGFFPLGNFRTNNERSEFVIYILPFTNSIQEKTPLPDPDAMLRELIGNYGEYIGNELK